MNDAPKVGPPPPTRQGWGAKRPSLAPAWRSAPGVPRERSPLLAAWCRGHARYYAPRDLVPLALEERADRLAARLDRAAADALARGDLAVSLHVEDVRRIARTLRPLAGLSREATA